MVCSNHLKLPDTVRCLNFHRMLLPVYQVHPQPDDAADSKIDEEADPGIHALSQRTEKCNRYRYHHGENPECVAALHRIGALPIRMLVVNADRRNHCQRIRTGTAKTHQIEKCTHKIRRVL